MTALVTVLLRAPNSDNAAQTQLPVSASIAIAARACSLQTRALSDCKLNMLGILCNGRRMHDSEVSVASE